MTLWELLGALILFGVIMWAVSAAPWIDASVKKVIYIIAVLLLVVWGLSALNMLPSFMNKKIG